ncbi:S24 family peptidase [Pseudomonas sp. RIT-To-2]|uniref:S24 family peptidase n=1 Tax=Pseudomonas sp. RIT-To-2 TaxID=3462541 RepID=UPI0024133316
MTTIEQVLADNLKYLMATRPDVATQPKLEERSGVGQTTIGRILRAETEAKIGTVQDLSTVFKLKPGDLLDPRLIDRLSELHVVNRDTRCDSGLVPLISWATLSTLTGPVNQIPGEDVEQWLESPFATTATTFCLKVRGGGMWPEYMNGEIIQLDSAVQAEHDDDIVVRTPDGKTTFKRLQDGDDGLYLLALNPEYPERIAKMSNGAIICGVCIGSWMDRRPFGLR